MTQAAGDAATNPRVAPAATRFGRAVARRVGLTEGQTWTSALGLVLALVTAAVTFPSVDRGGSAAVEPVRTSPDDRLPTAAAAPPPPDLPPGAVTFPPPPGVPAAPVDATLPAPPATGAIAGAEPAAPGTTAPPATGRTEGLGAGVVFAAVPAPGLPAAVTATPGGDVLVATDNAEGDPVVFRFDPAGQLAGTVPVTGRRRVRAHGLTAIALGAGGRTLVASADPAEILDVDLTAGTVRPYAVIPDVPPCIVASLLPPVAPCEPGTADDRPLPRGLAVDRSGRTYVSDAGQGTVWRVGPEGEVEQWSSGPGIDGVGQDGPGGVAFDPEGALVLTVARSAAAGSDGAVVRVRLGGDGRAGETTRVARTARGDRPAGVAVGRSGTVYVALSGANAVAAYGTDGRERGRYPRTGVGVDRPVGLAFRGDALLVTSTSTGANAHAVVRIPVGEPQVDVP